MAVGVTAPPQSCLWSRGVVNLVHRHLLSSPGMGCPRLGWVQLVGEHVMAEPAPCDSGWGPCSPGSCGQQGWLGTVVRPPCRWPVRRPCQPCTMFYSGPSSVQKVQPTRPVGRLCLPDCLLPSGASGRAVGGRDSTCSTVKGATLLLWVGFPWLPWPLAFRNGAVAAAWSSRVDWELQAQPSPALHPSLPLSLFCSPGWGRTEAQPSAAGAEDGPEQKGHREPGDCRPGHGAVRPRVYVPPDTVALSPSPSL